MSVLPIPVTRNGFVLPRKVWLFVTFLVSLMLVISSMSTVAADEPADDQEPAKVEKVLERPDRVSAMSTARAQDERVEILSERTETTQVFANADGTSTDEQYGTEVRVHDEDGGWEDVDYDLDKQADGSYAPKASAQDVTVNGGDSKEAARIAFDDGTSLAMSWPEVLPEPSIKGGVATYKLSDATDLIVAVTGGGVATRIRLNEAPAENDPVFTLGLRADDVEVDQTASGGLKITDEDGKQVGTTSTLVAWDAQVDNSGDPVNVVPVEADLTEVSSNGDVTKHDLELKAPEDFLNDPETQYPVTIDPDINAVSHIRDTWVRSGTTTVQGSSYRLLLGRIGEDPNTNQALAYEQWSNSELSGKTIIKATMGLYQYDAGSCSARQVNIHPLTSGFTEASTVYTNKPSSSTTTGDSTNFTTNRSRTGCPVGNGYVEADITNIVDSWAKATYTNYGVQLNVPSASANDTSYERRFCSSLPDSSATQTPCTTSTRVPYLKVTYDGPPDKPNAPTLSPATADGTTLWTTSKTPTFASPIVDSDTGPVRLHVKVLEGPTVKFDDYGSYVASGGLATKQLPSTSALADGHTYTVQSWANDGHLDSTSGSTIVTFKVDTTPPGAPTVACPGVSSDTWYDTRPVPSTTCTITPASGTQTIDWTRNNKPQPLMVKNASGNYTTGVVSIPAEGVVGLSFKARDIAGNLSSAKEFGFGTGNAGLLSPGEGERTSSTVTIDSQAPDGALSARVEQRPAGDTAATWTKATIVKPFGSDIGWLGLVSTGNGSSSTGKLVWDVEKEPSFSAPAVREMRVCFVYSGVTKCTPARNITLVPHAFGGSFPTEDAGPGQVALSTGEFQLDSTDVDVPGYSGSLTLGRSNRSYGGATTPAASVFGPGWVADLSGADSGFAAAEVIDHTADDGSITLLDTDGESSTYRHISGDVNAQANGTYVGDLETEELNEKLTITPSGTDKFLTLLEDDGATTIWKHLGSGEWAIEKVVEAENTSTTTFSHNAAGLVTGIYAPAPAGVTCNSTTQTAGCRALQLTYTTVAGADRLVQVDLRIYDPKPVESTGLPGTGAGMVTVPVAKYSYDSGGVLVAAWDPRVADGTAALKATYEYATVASHKVITKITPPGLTPWRFSYDTSGRFKTAVRTNPTSAGGGDATWTVAYSVPLSGVGLPDLTTTSVKTWGQTAAPVDATAVFAPDKAPAGTIADGDWAYGSISYFDIEGRTTNTAAFGADAWQIDSTSYDAKGNEVWSLDEGNRNLALSSGGDTEAVANSLATITRYNSAGTRAEEATGPSRSVVLKNGTQIVGRDHAETVYDDEADTSLMPGKPSTSPDAPPMDLAIQQVDSVVDANGVLYDTSETRYRYDPITVGDGDGWKLGAPTRVLTQDRSGWVTTTARVDSEGKILESRSPEGNATATTANDTRSEKTTYFTADASGGTTCGNKPQWTGLECQTFPAGQPSSGSTIPSTKMTGFDYLLNATRVEESSGSMTRTAVTVFDAAGRMVSDSTTMANAPSGDQTIPSSTYHYDSATGALLSVTAGSITQATDYDEWGRALSQTDGTGNTAKTVFDTAGRIKTSNDGKGTYTYTYDGTDASGKTEHRGLVTKVDVGLASGPDVFESAYDADGYEYLTKSPNGITKTTNYDAAGVENALTYKNADGSALLAFSGTFDSDGRQRTASSPMSTQKFSYDDLDRLSTVEDTTAAGCVTRSYGFSLDSDRTSLTTSGPDAGGACSASGATTTNSTFDDADRITNSGYTYDPFGRTRTVPAKDTDQAANIDGSGPQPGNLTISYFADDMVASLSQAVPDDDAGTTQTLNNTYTLDASERISKITASTANVSLRETTNHYDGGDDSPAWVSEKTRENASDPWVTVWKRYVSGPDGSMSTIESSDGTSKIQIANLHDDVVTQIDNTTTITGVGSYSESTEYGVARSSDDVLDTSYGWLGGHQRSTDTVGGLTLMGARLYNPMTGRFLSMDPVAGGNDNTYAYPTDPVNMTDLSGEWGMPKFVKKWKKKIVHAAKRAAKVIRRAARVVRTVHRMAKVAKRVVRYQARNYVKHRRASNKHVQAGPSKSKAKSKAKAKSKGSKKKSKKPPIYGKIGLSGCFFVCVVAAVGYDGDPDLTLGAGGGLAVGADVTFGGGYGTNEGGSINASCSMEIGPVGVYAEFGGTNAGIQGGGGGWAGGIGGGCPITGEYTW